MASIGESGSVFFLVRSKRTDFVPSLWRHWIKVTNWQGLLSFVKLARLTIPHIWPQSRNSDDIDPDLFIGADDAIETSDSDTSGDEYDDEASKPNSCLVDNAAVELVSKLNIIKEGQMSSDIFPADVNEFTDYLKRNRITGFRTLVRSVFSCPKVRLTLVG